MESDTVFIIVVIILAIIIVVAAWGWEQAEMHALEEKEDISSLPESEQIPALQELACFPWTQAVAWRRIVIATIISTFLIWLVLRTKMKVDLLTLLSIAVIIVATFMVIDMFRSFHWDRVICMKAAPDAPWFVKADGTSL